MNRRSLVLVVVLTACADVSSSEAPNDVTGDDGSRGSRSRSDEASRAHDGEGAAVDTERAVDPNVAVMHTDNGDIYFRYDYEDRVPLAEGDIVIPSEASETRSAVTSWTFRKWPNAQVPYVISADMPDHARVTDAIAHWEAKTALRFVARTTESDYVEFRSGTGCSSYIGRIGGRQYVDLSTGERATNVVAVAIDPSNDRVTYYFARGFMTVGTPTRADAFKAHAKYTLPAGKATSDIVDVAGTPAGETITWYKDGTISEGTFADLGAKSSGGSASLPPGKTWAMVQALSVDAQARVHAYYRDGTESVGTPADLASVSQPAPFSVAGGKTPAQLAHADFRKDGTPLFFYSNGDTSNGATTGRVSYPGHCGTGTTIHEIGHAVGLLHEQTRVDRDDYVVVNYANIQPGKSSNFDKHSVTSAADHGPYDFESIMHYDSYAFSSNGHPTITKKDGSTFSSQRTALSPNDIAGLTTLYP